MAAIIGMAAGALAAAYRHSALALPMLTVTVVGISIPSFFLALLIQIGSIAFYRRTGIRLVLFGSHLPGTKSLLPKMALPALVLVARPLAHITRVTFVSISEVLGQEYVRTARAKGLREILVFWNHVLRNAGVSILTAVVVSLRFALGSLPVAEIFFDWPGLGVTMLNGIFQRETSVVAGAALGLGVTFLLINLSLDLIYRVIDPRLRTQNNGGAL
jgi:peptide/nickel transport system permease protein